MTPVTTVGVVLALDTPLTTLAETKHVLLGLGQRVDLPPDALLCTHMVRHGQPHYAFTLTVADESYVTQLQTYFAGWLSAVSHGRPSTSSVDTEGLHLATTEALTRSGGRCVRFPGWAGIVGSPTVAEVLAGSAIDRLEVLGGTQADPSDVLDSRDFVRPLWRQGELVLPVLPAGAGSVAPFEVPHPTPCCGEHAKVSWSPSA